MDARLMSEQDLQDVTGKKRHTAQVTWFKSNFGLTPVQRKDGRIILTWAAFEGLQARRAGIGADQPPNSRPKLVPVGRHT